MSCKELDLEENGNLDAESLLIPRQWLAQHFPNESMHIQGKRTSKYIFVPLWRPQFEARWLRFSLPCSTDQGQIRSFSVQSNSLPGTLWTSQSKLSLNLVFNKIADSRQMISWDLINGGSLQYQPASNNIRLKKKIQQNHPTFYDIDSFVRRQLHFRVICSSWEKSNPTLMIMKKKIFFFQ